MHAENRKPEPVLKLLPETVMEQLEREGGAGQVRQKSTVDLNIPIVIALPSNTINHGISELDSPLSE